MLVAVNSEGCVGDSVPMSYCLGSCIVLQGATPIRPSVHVVLPLHRNYVATSLVHLATFDSVHFRLPGCPPRTPRILTYIVASLHTLCCTIVHVSFSVRIVDA